MISIVIPVFDELPNLQPLYDELAVVLDSLDDDGEIIFVDDGSTDESWNVIQQLAQQDSRVRGICFRRNFGKAAALNAAFRAARGSLILTMDGDLQDDPCEIPRFLDKLHEGFDVVSGWKRIRRDPWHKVLPSRFFNRWVSRLTGVKLHDHNCGFKAYRREVFDDVHLYGELHRFVPVLAASYGWKIGEIEVRHRPRHAGNSKYGLGRIPKGFLDLLTVQLLIGYGQRPQHALGLLGLIGFSLGAILMIILTVAWFVTRMVDGFQPIHLHSRAIFFYSLAALLLGAQFMASSFLAALVTAAHNQEHKHYAIRDTTADPDKP